MAHRTFVDHIEVLTTPSTIFHVYSQVEKWREWDHSIQYSHVGTFKSGGRGVLKSKNGPKSKMELLEVTDGASFTTKFGLPMCEMRLKYELQPVGERRTEVTHSVTFDGKLAAVFALLFGREVRKGLPAGLRRLKSISEGEFDRQSSRGAST
ncbi:hypothetical protein JOD64_005381 [Micromonospora luteifusca]|uniref:Polyketide cyclase / dehydrase and lipid transport n=2 Tax=Micromonospora luteifusca TaxID=709860 RepID=A0ABS2M139_9ACTN|nr:hypothetical protein [Micromonospora luteifusca]